MSRLRSRDRQRHRQAEPTAEVATIAHRQRARTRGLHNPEVENLLVEAIKGGNHVTNACHLAGIDQSTLYRWLRRADDVDELLTADPERTDLDERDWRYLRLRERLTKARADAQAMAVDATRRQIVGGQLIAEEPALSGDGLPIYDDGKLVYRRQWTQPDGRLALQFLGLSFPREWGKNPATRLEIVAADGAGGAGPGSALDAATDAVGAIAARLVAAREMRASRALEAAGPGDSDEGVTDAELIEEDAPDPNA